MIVRRVDPDDQPCSWRRSDDRAPRRPDDRAPRRTDDRSTSALYEDDRAPRRTGMIARLASTDDRAPRRTGRSLHRAAPRIAAPRRTDRSPASPSSGRSRTSARGLIARPLAHGRSRISRRPEDRAPAPPRRVIARRENAPDVRAPRRSEDRAPRRPEDRAPSAGSRKDRAPRRAMEDRAPNCAARRIARRRDPERDAGERIVEGAGAHVRQARQAAPLTGEIAVREPDRAHDPRLHARR